MTATSIRTNPSAASLASSLGANRTYRPEIQGLRALAVLLVVTYHVWLGRVSGGVDVFLLISSFLLTSSFVRKLDKSEAEGSGLLSPRSLIKHWLHVYKRLLPAAVVVILATLAGTWLVLPQSRWPALIDQAWASLLYKQNWLLADTAVDYYAQDHSAASPLQHFWSLSIQGQVFILWPVIFALAAVLRKVLCRWKVLNYRGLMAIIFGAIFVASLIYSIDQTAHNQAYAYFDTRTRLWEFALGSLLALAVPYLKPSRLVALFLGWGGLVAMFACGLVLTVDRSFPGFLALWPTLSAAAVIVAGASGHRLGADRILSSRPLVRLGDNSYALYLWHWPILVLFLAAMNLEKPSLWQGLLVVASSLILAVATTALVEKPLRTWQWPQARSWRSAVVIAVCAAVMAGPVSLWQSHMLAADRAIAAQPKEMTPGAAALAPENAGKVTPQAKVIPAPGAMKDEWADIDGLCTGENVPSDPLLSGCLQNDKPIKTTKTIVVLGDSHAQQYMAALGPVAKSHGWEVVTLLRGNCRYGADSDQRDADCNAFNEASRKYVLEHKPDAVFTVASLTHKEAPYETEVPGYLDGIKPFTDAGIDVVGIRDNPRFTYNMPECVQKKGANAADCNVPLEHSLAASSPLDDYKGKVQGLSLMDMSDFICTDGVCPAVVGNVYVYKDDNHLTKTYVQTMVPMFEKRLLKATGWK
ncbi:acyltransferase family protein [Pseudarthrobacter sp. J1738]|uniref:acyltransferase family protein n=1 Tax=Pseudarthrobacter sp. J1738 TaxID=3420446 RepID=UPI003D2A1469